MPLSAIIYEALFWILGMLLLWRIPRSSGARATGQGGAAAMLSVVIPARNEEKVLPGLLRSLCAQSSAPGEIIVVDDGSTDGTARVAAAGGARVVQAPPKPEEWVGKSWACWTGARAARGETLLFLDADVELSPVAVEDLCALHGREGGVITVQPYHAVRRLYERLSAVLNIVVMMGLDCFGILGRRLRPAGSFGPCMLLSRHAYFEVGGHRAVRREVVEDIALGRRCREAGLDVRCYGGRGSVSFRMYPGGIGQLVEGWTKSMASGAGGIRSLTFVLIVLWLCGATGAFAHLAVGVCRGAAGLPWLHGLGAAVGYVLYAAQAYWMLRRIGSFGVLTAVLYFVPLGFFHFVFLRSLFHTHLLRRVRWRGRTVRT